MFLVSLSGLTLGDTITITLLCIFLGPWLIYSIYKFIDDAIDSAKQAHKRKKGSFDGLKKPDEKPDERIEGHVFDEEFPEYEEQNDGPHFPEDIEEDDEDIGRRE